MHVQSNLPIRALYIRVQLVASTHFASRYQVLLYNDILSIMDHCKRVITGLGLIFTVRWLENIFWPSRVLGNSAHWNALCSAKKKKNWCFLPASLARAVGTKMCFNFLMMHSSFAVEIYSVSRPRSFSEQDYWSGTASSFVPLFDIKGVLMGGRGGGAENCSNSQAIPPFKQQRSVPAYHINSLVPTYSLEYPC